MTDNMSVGTDAMSAVTDNMSEGTDAISAVTDAMPAGVRPLEALHSDGEAEGHQEHGVNQGAQHLEGWGGVLGQWTFG